MAKDTKKRRFSLLIAEIIILLPKIIIALQAIPCTDIADEVAMLKVPAYLAGFDWSSSTANASYYGFGYFALFFPLFLFKLDIVTIYRSILIITSLIEGIIPILCFDMLESLWKVKKDVEKISITVIVSLITVNPPYNLINEHVLIMIIWVTVFLMCKLSTKQEKRRLYSGLLALTLVYSLTIHTRAIIIIGAVIVTIVLYFLLYRKSLVSKLFYPFIAIGYIASSWLVSFVQNCVWGSNNLANSSIYIPKEIELSETIMAFFDLLLGNVGTAFIFSKSFLGFMVMALLLFLFEILVEKRNRNKQRGRARNREINREINKARKKEIKKEIKQEIKKEIEQESKQERSKEEKEKLVFEKSFIIIFSVCAICTMATIGGLGIQHMEGLAEAISGNAEFFYDYKYLVYLRYFINYMAPLFLVGFVLYVKKPIYYTKTLVAGAVFTIIVYVLWFIRVIPHISDKYFGISNFYAFSWMIGKTVSDSIIEMDYMAIILLSIDFAILFLFSVFKERRRKIALVVFAVLLVYQYLYFPNTYANVVSQKYFEEIAQSQTFIEAVREQKDELEIYVYHENKGVPYLLQAYNYDLKVTWGLPEKVSEEVIVISNISIIGEIGEYYTEIQLDDNEWVYMKNIDESLYEL